MKLSLITVSPLQLDTDSVAEFARATRELKFESYNGGRDSKERLAQVTKIKLKCGSFLY